MPISAILSILVSVNNPNVGGSAYVVTPRLPRSASAPITVRTVQLWSTFEQKVEEILTDNDSRQYVRIGSEHLDDKILEIPQQIYLADTEIAPLPSIETPSVTKILSYTLPAIGVWLCSPVLSMIDTAAVGLLSGTAQQAALNPAVSVTDYGALIVAFMYTATTNLIAAAQQHDKSSSTTKGDPRTTATLLTGLKLAVIVGSAFGVILSLSASALIRTLIGNDSLDPAVMSAALRYVRIRSLGMPAALVIGTAQSACLGMQDVKSPLYVLMAAAFINLFGDMLLVGLDNLWLGGTAGAAWATVFSQYGALFLFLRLLTTNPRECRKVSNGSNVDVTKGIRVLTGSSKKGEWRRKLFSESLQSPKALMPWSHSSRSEPPPKSRGFLADGKLKFKDFFRPSKFDVPTAKEYLQFAVPVTTTSVGRISGYVAMSHVASSTLGTFDMAAHQIVYSIFCCLTPIVDGLSQVAQSFVPALFEHKVKSGARAKALSETVMNFRKCGAALGAVMLSLALCIPFLSRYFTMDTMVLSKVNGAIPGVSLFLVVNGLMCAGEGSLLGQKDLNFLRNSYLLFFFTVPAFMLRLKNRSLLGLQEVNIGTLWATFSAYNVIRASMFHLRLFQLQRRTVRDVETIAISY